MPELKNSQRQIYKATHVAIAPDINGKDKQQYDSTSRSVAKVGFLRSLNVRKTEIDALKETFGNQKKNRKQALAINKGLRTLQSLSEDNSPIGTFKHAPQVAKVDVKVLGQIGNKLVDLRRKKINQVNDSITSLFSAHRKYLSEIQNGSSVIAANRENPPTAKNTAVPKKATVPKVIATASNLPPSARAIFKNWSQLAPVTTTPVASIAAVTPSLPAALKWGIENDHPIVNTLYNYALDTLPPKLPVMQTDKFRIINSLIDLLPTLIDQTTSSVAAFNEYLPVEPVGRLHLERIEMVPVGIERGELVHSVPMTPKETVNISHREWSETTQGFENIVQDQFEGYSEKGVAEKNDVSQASDSESKHSTALNVGVSLSASYASVTLSTSFGYNTNSENSQSEKDSRNHSSQVTSKASARTRKDHKTSFKVSSVAGTEDLAVRVLTNPFDNPIRIDYYQMMRKWKVDLIRYGLRMTYDIVIPSPGSDLMLKLDQLRIINDQLNSPLNFDVTPLSITRDNWYDLAARWSATVDPPPPDTMAIEGNKPFQSADPDKKQFDSLVIEVDDKYTIGSSNFGSVYQASHDNQKPAKPDDGSNSIFDVINEPPGPSVGWGGYGSDLANLAGLSGSQNISFLYLRIISGLAFVQLNLKLKPEAFLQWQIRSCNIMRDAAIQADELNHKRLENQRSQLLDEINAFDGLSLRQMEREEIMKGVLRWLFGPGFELVPTDIQNLFPKVDPNNPLSVSLDPSTLPGAQFDNWQNVIQYGEFIKYIHNAIEWENVLYINYPYFWDSPQNWGFKRFLNHPDPQHRMFLRSGAARVVLTIRPGFEEGFTNLMDKGSFKDVPKNSPYVTIAQEIKNFAMTNYPGIPPANPDNNVRPLIYLEQKRTWKEMQYIMQLLEYYKENNGQYPAAAASQQIDENALKPFLTDANTDNSNQNTLLGTTVPDDMLPTYTKVPLKDIWGNPYFYKFPGDTGDYDLISNGADGKPGGIDKNADISANAQGSLISTWFEYTPTSALDIAMTTNLPSTNPADMA